MQNNHSKIIYAVCSAILLSFAIVLDNAYAQAYSWIDKNGNVIYGTNPPKGTQKTKLKTRKLSRYSSSRVLSRVKNPNSINSTKAVKRSTPPTRARLQNSYNSIESEEFSFIAAELSHDKAAVVVNEAGELTDCRVFINNPNDYSAREISVAFEFIDGSLIPAIGPAKIAARSSAEYLIAKDFLPLAIKTVENSKDETVSLVTNVILSGYQETAKEADKEKTNELNP